MKFISFITISLILAVKSARADIAYQVSDINTIVKRTAKYCEKTFQLGDFVITECPVKLRDEVQGKLRTITGGGKILYFLTLSKGSYIGYEAIMKEENGEYTICERDGALAYDLDVDYQLIDNPYQHKLHTNWDCYKWDVKNHKEIPLKEGENLFFSSIKND